MPEGTSRSSATRQLAQTAHAVVAVPEIVAYWLQGGRVDIGFLGAAQIDRFGNLNRGHRRSARASASRPPSSMGS